MITAPKRALQLGLSADRSMAQQPAYPSGHFTASSSNTQEPPFSAGAMSVGIRPGLPFAVVAQQRRHVLAMHDFIAGASPAYRTIF